MAKRHEKQFDEFQNNDMFFFWTIKNANFFYLCFQQLRVQYQSYIWTQIDRSDWCQFNNRHEADVDIRHEFVVLFCFLTTLISTIFQLCVNWKWMSI